MKKLPQHRNGRFAFILLALIIFQGAGWFLAWQAFQWHAKFEAQSMLFQENTPVREVVLERNYFQKIKVEHDEIRLEGNLYDIRNREWMGDSVRLVLYHDKHEEKLYSILDVRFSRLDDSKSTGPQPLSLWVAQWLGLVFMLPAEWKISLDERKLKALDFIWNFPSVSPARVPLFTPPRVVFEIAKTA